MTPPTLRLELADVHALRRELNDNLRVGGCFVHGAAGLSDSDACVLELVHPNDGAVLRLAARVVWVADEPTRKGIGLTLVDFSSDTRDQIGRFIEGHEGDLPAPAQGDLPAPEQGDLPAPEQLLLADDEEGLFGDEEDLFGCDGELHAIDEAAPAEQPPPAADEPPRTAADEPLGAADGDASGYARHVRLRGLSSTEQTKVARGSEAADRVVLERIYGKAVWPALVGNPRLTPPEVARLARMGNMPRPQLEQIVANGAWLQNAQVRRALLTNPRVSQDMALKVLRLMPKHELKLVPSQTAYPQSARSAARRLLGR